MLPARTAMLTTLWRVFFLFLFCCCSRSPGVVVPCACSIDQLQVGALPWGCVSLAMCLSHFMARRSIFLFWPFLSFACAWLLQRGSEAAQCQQRAGR